MRILQIAESYWPQATGVSVVAQNLARELLSRGHQVTVATTACGSSAVHESVDGIPIYRFPCHGNYVRGLQGPIGRFSEFVRSGSWNVLIVHCAQVWCTDALLLSGPLDMPLVFVSHGLSLYGDRRYSDYYRRLAAALEARKAIIVSLSPLLEERLFCAEFDLTPPITIPNGVRLSEWLTDDVPDVRAAWSIGSAPWIVTVSNHSTVKNHALFWSTIRTISERTNVLGTIIGSSYPAAWGHLGRVGIKGGCYYTCKWRAVAQRCVTLRLDTPRDFVRGAVKSADVLLITSNREALPLVALEAAAAGTPWVSTDVGAVREIGGGIVVSEPARVAGAVRELIGNWSERQRLSAEGRAFAANRTWEMIGNAYDSLCRRVSVC